IDKDWKSLWKEDLEPYRALRQEVAFVMVAHAAYPAIAGDLTPASLSSKWMTEMLRGVLDYQGIIVTDDLEMGAIVNAGPIEQAAIQSIRAGADMFLVCHSQERVLSCYQALVREAEQNPSFRKRVECTAERVSAKKKKSRELKDVSQSPT